MGTIRKEVMDKCFHCKRIITNRMRKKIEFRSIGYGNVYDALINLKDMFSIFTTLFENAKGKVVICSPACLARLISKKIDPDCASLPISEKIKRV